MIVQVAKNAGNKQRRKTAQRNVAVFLTILNLNLTLLEDVGRSKQ